MRKQFIIIPRKPTPNGLLHLGHIAGLNLKESQVSEVETSLAPKQALKTGKSTDGQTFLPGWLFVTKVGTPLNSANVGRSMQSILKEAKLPLHFMPHCLRHTYASILLADGVSPVYVQEQLGHATIDLTGSTYGRWLKKKALDVLDWLDFVSEVASGSRRALCTESADRNQSATA